MVNRPHKFQDRDIKRVIRASREAGLNPVTVEVDPRTGTIKVTSNATAPSADPLDRELEEFRTKHG